MIYTLQKEENSFVVKEEGRKIYTVEKDEKDALASIALKNRYGDDILHLYQIKKWYHMLKFLKMSDFAVYEDDRKIGALRKTKQGYQFELHGVSYQMYGGRHATKRTIIVFDREVQVAQFTLDEVSEATFTNGVFGSYYAMFLYVFTQFSKEEDFSSEAFQEHYKGLYLKDLEDAAA